MSPVGLRVPVEIEAPPPHGRWWRLSWGVTPDRVELLRPLPLEPGTPVTARFALPGGPALEVPARVAAPAALELGPDPAARAALESHVREQSE